MIWRKTAFRKKMIRKTCVVDLVDKNACIKQTGRKHVVSSFV